MDDGAPDAATDAASDASPDAALVVPPRPPACADAGDALFCEDFSDGLALDWRGPHPVFGGVGEAEVVDGGYTLLSDLVGGHARPLPAPIEDARRITVTFAVRYVGGGAGVTLLASDPEGAGPLSYTLQVLDEGVPFVCVLHRPSGRLLAFAPSPVDLTDTLWHEVEMDRQADGQWVMRVDGQPTIGGVSRADEVPYDTFVDVGLHVQPPAGGPGSWLDDIVIRRPPPE